MLTQWDYLVIAFYFVFMTSIGWVMKRFIRNTSDYFRAGGEMLWWIAGAGAFMGTFSAVTFTGMAGKAFKDGPVVLVIFLGNALGFFLNYLWLAALSRQTRAVTAMEVVRARFGKVSEQFFTWIQIPVGTFYAGLWLMGLGVFVSAGFGWNLERTMVVTGVVVLIMSLLGGSWSVTAGDFVQMLVLMPISIVAAVLALYHIGGPTEFIEKVPTHFFHWGEVANSNLIALWVIATLMQKLIATNSMQDCYRYLCVKDTKNAKKAALLGTCLFLIGPAVWFIPPMVARAINLDLKTMFPNLSNPTEAAYFAMAVKVMPAGVVGLLLSGIFGATMSAMDGGLNKNAGFFVKNFYQPYVRPQASERELMLASKIATVILGVFVILAGLWFAANKDKSIFDMMTHFSAYAGLPVGVPLVLGLFFKKAPGWAGWSSVLLGFAMSFITDRFLQPEHLKGFTFNAREASDYTFVVGTFLNVGVQTTYFIIANFIGHPKTTTTTVSGGHGSTIASAAEIGDAGYTTLAAVKDLPEAQRIPAFFRLIKTPVNFEAEESSAGSDNSQAKVMGLLSLIYGTFVTLLALVPNPMLGRLSFLFCGGTMLVIGYALHRAGVRGSTKSEALNPK